MPHRALLALGLRLRRVIARRRRPPRRPVPQVVLAGDGAASPGVAGCGCFDSSLDLSRGLLVREFASLDAAAAELPPAEWTRLFAQGRRGAPWR